MSSESSRAEPRASVSAGRCRSAAANASAPPAAATTAPEVARRSTRARTGEDASIAKDTADGPFTNGLHGRYAENTAVGETCQRVCASDVWAVRHRSTGDEDAEDT